MGVMNRLLNKTLVYYSFSAIIILLLSAPFIYYTLEKLYKDDVDEAILLRSDEFTRNHEPTLKITDIPTWNRFNGDTRILPDTVKSKPKNNIIQQVFLDTLVPEWEPYRVLYKDVSIQGKPFVLMIRLNLVESEDLIRTIVWIYLGILFVLLLVIFFITLFISNKLWYPFHDTLKKIEQFSIESNQMPAFKKTGIKEFNQLNKSLTKLIQQTLQSFDLQKVFIQNASHELQTPLAIFQSKLDLLMQDSHLQEQQLNIVHSLYESVSKLKRINKNLLLLAKIENNQFIETSSISIKEIIEEVIPYFSEQAIGKNITIHTELKNNLTIQCNKTLIEILIHNLFLNAVRHNILNGSIYKNTENNRFTIINSGINAPLDTSIIFERFKKGSKNPKSTGLGLAIVKEICIRNGWQIDYKFKNGMHCFILVF
jgi:signal transduction histidine kinase